MRELFVAIRLAVRRAMRWPRRSTSWWRAPSPPPPSSRICATLTDSIGGRPSGSPALERAVDWAIARFRAAGVDDVRAERYDAPRLWLPRKESAELIAPASAGGRVALRVAAMPFAPSTPSGGLEADVVDVGHGDDAGVAAAGKLTGRFALVHTDPMRTHRRSVQGVPRDAAAHRAAAQGRRRRRALPVEPLRAAALSSQRDARRHHGHRCPPSSSSAKAACAWRASSPAASRCACASPSPPTTPARAPSRNVVAELRGREKPDEVVILGAHLDSWDLGRGALDNGCNVALVIDVARALRRPRPSAASGPRRTVRFMLYTGEEAGLWGSLADARAHRAELDRVRAQIVFDEGSGRTTGFSLGGRADLKAAVDAALAPLAGLGPFTQTVDAFVGTDNYDYLVEGVPTLVANQDGAPYLPDYHAESDTFDKVDLRELRANVAIAGAVTWALADRAEPPAPRQSRAEVEALLKATGLDAQMKTSSACGPTSTPAHGGALAKGCRCV